MSQQSSFYIVEKLHLDYFIFNDAIDCLDLVLCILLAWRCEWIAVVDKNIDTELEYWIPITDMNPLTTIFILHSDNRCSMKIVPFHYHKNGSGHIRLRVRHRTVSC